MKQNIIFIHIPKTGGTTIKKTFKQLKLPLQEFKGSNHCINYQTFKFENRYHTKFQKKTDNTFVFSFVRNPYDRFYSTYLYAKHKMPNKLVPLFHVSWFSFIFFTIVLAVAMCCFVQLVRPLPFKILVGILAALLVMASILNIAVLSSLKYMDLDYFMNVVFPVLNRLAPYTVQRQYKYIETQQLDFLGRQESFEKDLRTLLNKLGVSEYSSIKIPTANQTADSKLTNGYKYLDKLKRRHIEFINKFYKKDFEEYNYPML